MSSTDQNKMPMPKAPVLQPQKTTVEHPAVREHIAHISNMAHEIDKLRKENAALQHHLDVERKFTGELQHSVDHERKEKEKYQRYAVRADTYFTQLATLADQARDESLKMAQTSPQQIEQQPQQPEERPAPDIDEGLAEIARRFAPKAP